MAVPFNSLVTSTVEKYLDKGKVEDNVFSAVPLLYWLNRKAAVTTQGGRKIRMALGYDTNDTVASYSGYDRIDLTPQETETMVEYDWKQFAASVSISGIEDFQNSGEEAIYDFVKQKITNAEDSLADWLDNILFLDGTGNTSKDPLGLAALVGVGTLGGIDGSVETWWRASVTSGADATLTMALLDNKYNTVTRGKPNYKPDLELTTQVLFEKHMSLLQPNMRFTDPKTADAGFENITHRGAVVMWAPHCPAKHYYFLNAKVLKFVKSSTKWMKFRGWQEPEDMDAQFGLILSYGNFVTNNRRHLGSFQNLVP